MYAPAYVTCALSWSSSGVSNLSLRIILGYEDYPRMAICTIHLFLFPSRSSPHSGIAVGESKAPFRDNGPSSLFLCPLSLTET